MSNNNYQHISKLTATNDPDLLAFKHGIKRDPEKSTLLKHEKYRDTWNIYFNAISNVQDVANILNPKHVPMGPESHLFLEQQKYVYQVFIKQC